MRGRVPNAHPDGGVLSVSSPERKRHLVQVLEGNLRSSEEATDEAARADGAHPRGRRPLGVLARASEEGEDIDEAEGCFGADSDVSC